MVVSCVAVGLFEAYGQQSAARANPATADFRQFLTEHRADLGAADAALTTITVDYPREGSVFPLDFAAPLFQWRDASSEATVWRVEVSERGREPRMKVWSAGEKMQIGPVDASLVGFVQPTLTAEQAASHTWRPDAKTWEEMKKHSQRAGGDGSAHGLQKSIGQAGGVDGRGDGGDVARSGGSADYVSGCATDSAAAGERGAGSDQAAAGFSAADDQVAAAVRFGFRQQDGDDGAADVRELPLAVARREDAGHRCGRAAER